jgi:PTH1 family peptidyl-tRNA hydrolase
MADTAPWLLVGLGNPGPKYAHNRHNVGFMGVERWLDRHGTPGADGWREKFHGEFSSVSGPFGRCVVLKPLTFMNVSGKSVGAACTFFRVPPTKVIVLHDELDFPFGRLAIKKGGGHGGHNGLRDIISVLGSKDFLRVRMGIGRPPRGNMDVAAWVLKDFSADEVADLADLVDRAHEAATAVMTDGVASAMNKINQTGSKKAPKPASKPASE